MQTAPEPALSMVALLEALPAQNLYGLRMTSVESKMAAMTEEERIETIVRSTKELSTAVRGATLASDALQPVLQTLSAVIEHTYEAAGAGGLVGHGADAVGCRASPSSW